MLDHLIYSGLVNQTKQSNERTREESGYCDSEVKIHTTSSHACCVISKKAIPYSLDIDAITAFPNFKIGYMQFCKMYMYF